MLSWDEKTLIYLLPFYGLVSWNNCKIYSTRGKMELEILAGTWRGRAAVQRREWRSEFSKEKHQAKYKWRERERDCHISNDRARAFWCASTQVFCALLCVCVRVHINSAARGVHTWMHLFHAEIKKLLAVAVFFAIHYLFSFHLCHTRDVSSNECSPACFIGRNARIIIRITVCVCVCMCARARFVRGVRAHHSWIRTMAKIMKKHHPASARSAPASRARWNINKEPCKMCVRRPPSAQVCARLLIMRPPASWPLITHRHASDHRIWLRTDKILWSAWRLWLIE